MGFSQCHEPSMVETNHSITANSSPLQEKNENVVAQNRNGRFSKHMTHTRTASTPSQPAPASSPQLDAIKQINQPSIHEVSSERIRNVNKKDDEWKVVTYRKKKPKYRYLGKIGVASELDTKFKAAEKKTPIFISNVHKDTKESDIADYIQSKVHESVSLQKIDIRRQSNHNAYKFFVSQNKLPLFLDEKLWPRGIIFRRFVHFRAMPNNRLSSGDGLVNSSHG